MDTLESGPVSQAEALTPAAQKPVTESETAPESAPTSPLEDLDILVGMELFQALLDSFNATTAWRNNEPYFKTRGHVTIPMTPEAKRCAKRVQAIILSGESRFQLQTNNRN